ncbi:hypothetical protein LCGC14_1020990 [marine sediment metagenome]|uniref:Phosphoadenosine phosphosulphate reductase domain-containing protein n=1 Tax=marine sediment metagenome TaxID=412755 RepID=A0A0F9QFI0_9ZZZZ
MEPYEFVQKQSLPYKAKITHAKLRAREFFDFLDGNVYCSVGGLDSITLLLFLRKYVSKDIPGVSVSSLEDKSIQAVHSQLDNMVILKPEKSKAQVLKEFGYPLLSKDKAIKIEFLQNPTEKNATVRHNIITGDTGKRGGYKNSRRMRLPDKWQRLFVEQEAPFRVSGKCCYYMKEQPCGRYARETGRFVYMGLMADEGGRREISLKLHGCNYYGKTVTRSCPFAIFNKTDLLRLALELNVPVPEVYGQIAETTDGQLTTTLAKRTGCTMCGFGIHLEKRPHRFDRLRASDYKEWHFWMYDKGWGNVLSYIGVEWENHPGVLV